jgi:hypothetical protein
VESAASAVGGNRLLQQLQQHLERQSEPTAVEAVPLLILGSGLIFLVQIIVRDFNVKGLRVLHLIFVFDQRLRPEQELVLPRGRLRRSGLYPRQPLDLPRPDQCP